MFYRIKTLIVILGLLVIGSVNCDAANNRALLIGLGKQKDQSWGKIHGDNDVHYVARYLKNAGFQDIQTLTNENATKVAIVKAFNDLAARCKKGDVVYVHYSGHGQLMTDLNGDEEKKWGQKRHAGWDESWIPYDAYMNYGKYDKGEKHLCDDEVAVLLTAIRKKIGAGGEIIVAIDACHSGDATCGEEDECVRGVDIKFNIPRSYSNRQEEPMQEQWMTISACKPYQLAMEVRFLNIGKLTYALCSLGKQVFSMESSTLESTLVQFMEMNKGRLPQTPVVSGRKK